MSSSFSFTDSIVASFESALLRSDVPCSRVHFIVDETVYNLHRETLDNLLHVGNRPSAVSLLPSGEKFKTWPEAGRILGEMVELGCDRSTLVVGVGGGVATDLAGFVASVYMRGLPVLLIPTTLLAIVDAAIGGKTAVNLPAGKNLVGSFWSPIETLIDSSFLSTLPERELKAAWAEIIKMGVIVGEPLFLHVEAEATSRLPSQNLLEKVIAAKEAVVERDFRERSGARILLNYGHTFAHALESTTGYQTYLHGEAVAIGIALANRLSMRLGYANLSFADRVENLLETIGLPIEGEWEAEALLQAMKSDKKNSSGQITCVLAESMGKVFPVKGVSEDVLLELLDGKGARL